MNTQYSNEIKKAKQDFDTSLLLKSNNMTPQEKRLAYGKHVIAPVYLVVLGNAFIFGMRNNLMNNKSFTAFAIFGSFFISLFTCKYLFGHENLRRIWKVNNDTIESATFYESIVANSQKSK